METTVILLDNMLVLNCNLNPNIIRTENFRNGVWFMVAQIMGGVADTEMIQLIGSELCGLIPSRAIVEVIMQPQLHIAHIRSIVRGI